MIPWEDRKYVNPRKKIFKNLKTGEILELELQDDPDNILKESKTPLIADNLNLAQQELVDDMSKIYMGMNITADTVKGTGRVNKAYGFCRQETRSGKNKFDLDKWFENASSYNCSKELIQNGIKLVFTANTDAFVGTNMSGVGQTLGASYKNQLIEVKSSTKYTISLSSAPKCYVSQYNEDLTSVMFERIPENTSQTQYTITTNSNAKYIGLRLGILDSSLTNYNFTNIQIEEGEVATEYEQYGASPSPDFSGEIRSVGDDVNLFDKNGEVTNLYITDSGSEAVGAGSDQFIKQVFNSKNSNYIMSFDKNINNAYVRFTYYEGDTFISREISGANGHVFNVPKACTKVDIRTNTTDKYFTNLKLQKGTVATPWSPFRV